MIFVSQNTFTVYSKNFTKCLIKTLKFEAGYVNDPDDPGKETVFGISKRFYPDWSGWKIIDKIYPKKEITLDFLQKNPNLFNGVAEFYFNNFYLSIKGDKIEKIYPNLACNVFDFAVNAGRKSSIKSLQQAINKILEKLNESKISVDGVIGNQTLKALEKIKENDGSDFEKELIWYFKQQRVKYYVKITSKNHSLIKFLKGWINRVFDS